MIVGITARALCRGPNVLNGRATTTGVPNERWYESASWSAPTLVAAYGDCGCSGCSSKIGTVCGRAVHLARRRVHDALDVLAARRLENVQRPLDVRRDELPRVEVRVRDRDERAQVQDHVLARDRAHERLGVDQVAAEDVDLGEDLGGRVLEPPVVAARRVADECAHRRAGSHERFDKVAADEAAGARDEHPAARPKRRALSPGLGGTRANLLRMEV